MTRGPLSGLAVAAPPGAPRAVVVAAEVLGSLGAGRETGALPDVALDVGPAREAPGGPAGAILVRTGAPSEEPGGVPDGCLDHAVGLALAAGALAGVLGRTRVEVRPADVALQLFLPQVMAAAYGSPTWPAPPEPARAPGAGWLCAELGAPGDRLRFDVLLSTLGPGAGAGAVARAAQEWRLPVCDYRPWPAAPEQAASDGPVRLAGPDTGSSGTGPTGEAPADRWRPPLAAVTVVDLTAMWAGPLCTWLLGRLGATIWKVEPDVRPDGMRALDGRGIHPGGRSSAPGSDSGLFHALNSGKRRAPWDLRRPADHRRLLDAVAGADLVVDSFSPRVMPNLGLTREALTAARPDLVTLSIPAFPPGPLRDWVAYGTGVHAVSGLGALPAGSPAGYAAPAVTYPDPLAGLTAAVAALAGLVGRRRGWSPVHLEVALQSAVLPLLARGRPTARLAERDPDVGPALLRAAGPDATHPLDVAGRCLAHPVGPFRVPAGVARLEPAPPWPEHAP